MSLNTASNSLPKPKANSESSSRLLRPQDKRLYVVLGEVGIFYAIL